MMETVPRVALIVLSLSALTFAGCIDTSASGPCPTYPDQEDLFERWSSMANHTRANYDVVRFGVSTWGRGAGEDPQGTPDPYVEWDSWPEDERPAILHDILCATLGRIEDDGWKGDPAAITPAPEWVAKDAMNRLEQEHDRQTGVSPEPCCYLRFEGEFYGVGYMQNEPSW